MSLHNKAHLLARLKPTVAVLPESANTASTRSALAAIGASSVEWIGGNPNKGLSVAAFNGWQLTVDGSYDPGYQWVMPVHLTGPAHIRLLAVWDMNHRGSGHQSARQMGACRSAIPHYDEFLSGPADLALISGDFNNSIYWDKPTKRAKFGDFMDQLEARGFVSAYHLLYGCERGAEVHPTLWWMKNLNTTYHIDYTFVSPSAAVESVVMGEHSDWIAHSDHSPMTIDMLVRSHDQPALKPVVPRDHEAKVRESSSKSGRHEPLRGEVRSEHPDLVRFPIEPGAIPDMPCGVNGEPFVQVLRPSHFTAQWAAGVLVEVRVWGPRVLQDGSPGKRELDHRWKRSRAAGGVVYDDLPRIVADRLRSYVADVAMGQ